MFNFKLAPVAFPAVANPQLSTISQNLQNLSVAFVHGAAVLLALQRPHSSTFLASRVSRRATKINQKNHEDYRVFVLS